MSARPLFQPGGQAWSGVPGNWHEIPRGDRLAAWCVWMAILGCLADGELMLGERWTDRMLLQTPWLRGYKRRFVQKGLKTLEARGIIARKRQYGRRTITITGRLAGRGPQLPAEGRPKLPSKPAGKTSKPLSYGTASPRGKETPPEVLAAIAAREAAAKAEQDRVSREWRRKERERLAASNAPGNPESPQAP
jgi:hypothetical protein